MAGGETEGVWGPKKSLPALVFPEAFLLRLGSLVALEVAYSLPAFSVRGDLQGEIVLHLHPAFSAHRASCLPGAGCP